MTMARCSVLSALVLCLTSSIAQAVPLGSVSGLPGATGLAVNPGTGDLYVKSAISGTLWRVPVAADGSLGAADSVSADLGTAIRIGFDLAGNLYGMQPQGGPVYFFLRRLAPGNTLAQQTRLYTGGGGFGPSPTATGAFAIESPGGSTNRFFFSVAPNDFYTLLLGQFAPGSTLINLGGAETCSGFRSMAYRPLLGDLIATIPNLVLRVSPQDGSCTTIPGGMGFVSLQGIAWNNAAQRIFVTDDGTGTVTAINADGSTYVIANGLQSPADVAFSSAHVFVAEPAAGRVLSFSADPPPTPTLTPTATFTFTPLPTSTSTATFTRTVTPTSTETPTPTLTRTPTVTPTTTDTATVTATSSSSATPTDTASATATPTASATPPPSQTATPSPTVPCDGDCDGDGAVAIQELILAVRIALDPAAGECAAVDRNGNGVVTVDELIAAVNRALTNCEGV